MLRYIRAVGAGGSLVSTLELRFGSTIPNTTLAERRIGASLQRLNAADTLSWLYRLNRSCLQLQAITYEGVRDQKIQDALHDLVNTNWNTYSQFLSDFPSDLVTREVTVVRGRQRVTRTNITRLVKQRNSETARQKLLAALDAFIADNSAGAFELPVDAATWIGNAEDNLAVGFQHSTQSPLNPIYFFRLLLKWRDYAVDGERLIEFAQDYGLVSLLSDAPSSASVHPLLWLLKFPQDPDDNTENYLQFIDEPIDRHAIVNGREVPLERLWRLFVPPTSNRVGLISQNARVSDLVDYNTHVIPGEATDEWRLDDFGYLVSRKKQANRLYPWHEEAYFTFDDRSFQRINSIWSQYGTMINDTTVPFPLPVEVLGAIIARESGGGPTACGLEPWPVRYELLEGDSPFPAHPLYGEMTYIKITVDGRNVSVRLRDRTVPVTLVDDQAALGAEVKTFLIATFGSRLATAQGLDPLNALATRVQVWLDTTPGSILTLWLSCLPITRHNTPVPTSQPDWRTVQIAHSGLAYTWQGLLDDLVDQALARRVSPGLVQALVTVADGRLPVLRAKGVAGLPLDHQYGDIFVWLLTPANSIMVGMALLDLIRPSTGYDPIKQRINYGSGNLNTENNTTFGYVGSHHITTGQAISRGGGAQPWANYYNAVVAYFNQHDGDAPGVFTQPAIRMASVPE